MRLGREAADRDQKNPAADHAPRTMATTTGMDLIQGMEVCPGAHLHLAVQRVLLGVLGRGRGPRGRLLAHELGPVLTGAPARPLAGRIRVEAPIAAQADEHRDGYVTQLAGERFGLIAGIKHEQGRPSAGWAALECGAYRFGGNRMPIGSRRDAPYIHGRGPAIAREGELGHRLVGPASHDRLAAGVAEGMVMLIVTPLGTGLCLTARRDADIDRVDRLVLGQPLVRDETAQRGVVNPPFGQGGI